MANLSADVAGNAFLFFCKNSITGESVVDVHQGCKRAAKTAPDSSAKKEINANS
jgi:hypothetical protein